MKFIQKACLLSIFLSQIASAEMMQEVPIGSRSELILESRDCFSSKFSSYARWLEFVEERNKGNPHFELSDFQSRRSESAYISVRDSCLLYTSPSPRD